ncbi:MAG TPA: S1 RNA-binding domain-containing protein [Tepidisphaeraceae bacterium]|jgi:small subunit ribosomal protein S1|nr:S1 RNA-binding domain-containing protein [Tepidisphaeraceae bacterium]
MSKDPNKEKFRPSNVTLEAEVDAALGDLALDELMEHGAEKRTFLAKNSTRTGRIIRVTPDDVFVDFGGKDQGICAHEEFETEPTVGQDMEFTVERYDRDEGIYTIHRKGVANTSATWETLEVGQIVEGIVTDVNKGGLELEVKGMRAFMPAGQVEIFHVPDLAQFKGQKFQAEVTQFSRESRNLILSRRNILERERDELKKKTLEELTEGQVRRGTVRNVMDFGAFVDIGGMEGLLHVSELSFQRGRHKASDFLKVGDVLDVKVTRIDRETGKIGLSLRQARGIDPWADAQTRYAVGSTLTGRVVKVESFGVFIEVEEGIEGLLPVSEMSYQRIKHPSDMAKEGDTLKLVVLSIDPAARKMSFSLKQAGPDPWKTVAERYATEMTVTGTVTRVVDFGAFVELEPGLEGLIHVSELANQRVRSSGDVVKVGDEVKVRVLEVDSEARRISLSLKRAAATSMEPSTATPAAESAAPQKPKKKKELKGGLDWGWQ